MITLCEDLSALFGKRQSGVPIRKIVITGGPYSGKTTLVQQLALLGFTVIPESAIEIIKELNVRLGVEGQKTWRREHPVEFQTMVTHRQTQQENNITSAPENTAFCDRGRYDAIAYCQFYGIPLTKKLLRLIEEAGYDQVFILDTLSTFSQRPETGRTSDRKASLQLRDLLEDTYRHYGFCPERVPESTIQIRAKFILCELRLNECCFPE